MQSLVQTTFQRREIKYLLTSRQSDEIQERLRCRMQYDQHGRYTICNLYYDTDDFRLIRASIDKPIYKEKFRLRRYGASNAEPIVFAEIKKKYKGIVYKRRIAAEPQQIEAFLAGNDIDDADKQIQREIQWFLRQYPISPKVYIGYDRVALAGLDDSNLRVTFDSNLRWRTQNLVLEDQSENRPVLDANKIVMEIKAAQALPLWLARELSAVKAYPIGFSKYGACYQRHIAPKLFERSLPNAH